MIIIYVKDGKVAAVERVSYKNPCPDLLSSDDYSVVYIKEDWLKPKAYKGSTGEEVDYDDEE